MRLKLTVRIAPAKERNFLVTADATARIGDVAAALAGADPVAPKDPVDPLSVTLRIFGAGGGSQLLAADSSLLDSGVRSGYLVAIEPAPRRRAMDRSDRAAVLRIIGGPDVGKEASLPFGSSMIGRGAGNDVVVTDALVSKVHARITVGDGVEVIDQNSANGIVVGGQRVGRIRVGPEDEVVLGDTILTIVQTLRGTAAQASSTDIRFTRSPQVVPRPAAREIELPEVPRPPERARFPLLAMIAPLAMGVALFMSTREQTMSLIFVALSPVIMLFTYFDQRLRQRQKHQDDVAHFESALARNRREVTAAHDFDRECLLRAYPSVQELGEGAVRLGPSLWSRRPEHPEFLRLRLGLGDILPITTLKRGHSAGAGLVEFEEQADALLRDFAVLADAPVVADLRSCGSLGLCGPGDVLDGVARGLMVQLVCTHSPAELSIACLTSKSGVPRWGWLEWVPHTSSPHSPLGALHLASDPATGGVLLSHLEEIVDSRTREAAPKPRGPLEKGERVDMPTIPSIVVLVDDATVDQGRLTRVAERGPDVGVHVIWCARFRKEIPAACRTFLEVTGEGSDVGSVRSGSIVSPVRVEAVDAGVAETLGRVLAPVDDVGVPVEDTSDLPRAITYVALTGQELADSPEATVQRWRQNQSLIDRNGPAVPLKQPINLRALVGHAGTEPFTLDLRSQGPHALVGGTTGAGKSEFLQAWVLGMASAHSPDRVTFLFVDYKGGAAFATCTDLPHCVGLVTDLSPYLVRRALASLRAELRHREHLLQRKGAKDLVELEKRGDPECPPSLIIVVDEFAALVGEVPQFVDGVVDVAQRGRSLGLHLILATQRPAGVIKDNLRANTNLRVALRMADEHDSSDVLGEKTAASFDPAIPGRGAAKTGPGRITQFQSGYPGAKTPPVATASPVEILELNFGGGIPWRTPERTTDLEDLETDIVRLVNTMKAASGRAGLRAPRRPWLEGLAPAYDLSKLEQRRDTELALGVLDDPDTQTQRTEYFLPDKEGNIAYYGAGGSGKTTALRSLALAASITPRSGGVHVYGLDFAGGGLGLLETLPNVGAIIDGGDDERIARLFRFLRTVADERQATYSALRAPTLTEYRTLSGRASEPRILVLIDGMGTFKTEYEGSSERQAVFGLFQQLLVDGRGVGIHFAVAAERPAAIPTSMTTSFQRKVVLRQTDDDGYRFLDLPRDVLTPASPPGRAMQADEPKELQLAILGDNTNVAAQARMVEAMGTYMRTLDLVPVLPIRSLPTQVRADEMPPTVTGKPVLGLADETLEPIGFTPGGAIMIWGPMQSGRTNALHWMARSLRNWDAGLPIVHLSARRSPLAGLDLWSMSATGWDACGKLLDRLKQVTSEEAPEGHPLVALLIEGYPEFLSSSVENTLAEVVRNCRTNGHLVIAEGESSTWNSSWPLLTEVRNARTGLMLQPDYLDGESVLRTPLPRFKKGEPIPGRGWWIHAGKSAKLQIPLVE